MTKCIGSGGGSSGDGKRRRRRCSVRPRDEGVALGWVAGIQFVDSRSVAEHVTQCCGSRRLIDAIQ